MSTLPNPAQPPVPTTPMDLLQTSRASTARSDADRAADAGRSDFSDRLDRERSSDRSERADSRADNRADDRTERPAQSDRSERSERQDRSEQVSDSKANATSAGDNETDDASAPATETDRDAASSQDGEGTAQQDSASIDSGAEEDVAEESQATILELVEALRAETESQPGGLTLVGLSGETIELAQPTTPLAGAANPGELGRWFMEASGPVVQSAQAGPAAQQAGLLNALQNGQLTNLASTGSNGVPSGLLGPDGQPLQAGTNGQANGTTGDGTLMQASQSSDFADALAQSNAQTDTLDQFLGQAMAKTSAADLAAQPTQTVMTGQSMAASAQPMASAAPTASTGQAVPVTALAVEITRQAVNGKTQFDIRLDPPELGRLNVRLEMDASGQTRTHLVVERSETLEMLMTDARNLERALQQAGLKADPGSVSFELAQDSNDGLGQSGDQASNGDGTQPDTNETLLGEEAGADDTLPVSPEAMRYQVNVTGHLDVRV